MNREDEDQIISEELDSLRAYFSIYEDPTGLTKDQCKYIESCLRITYHSGAIAAIKGMARI